ncbi:MAG: hypothetical protein LCH58_06115 [Bacteroidetes bacterium]|uniref:hypothetical protein n=1 Tax=Phnomibacter sp. TaxID=2836217 RepID=UPI002FDD82A3|nr:hypothetical protein [Bacteroidota bacterium]
MKRFLFFVAACFCSLLSVAQSTSIIANTVDARKAIYVPRLTTLPTARPGLLVYKTTGADSGLYIGRTTGSTWNKVFPGSGGTSYTIGNGLKQVGSTLQWADTLLNNTTVNLIGSTQLKFTYSSPSNNTPYYYLSPFSAEMKGIDRYNNTIILGAGGNSYNNGISLQSAFYGGSAGTEGSTGSSIRLRGDTIRAQDGFLSTQYKPIAASLTKYDFWGYDKVSGAFVRIPSTLLPTGSTIDTTSLSVRINQKLQEVTAGTGITTMPYGGSYNGVIVNADTAGIIASKANVANQIAAATLSTIPGVIDVQDVQNGGLRCTNCSTQTFTDSSYLTKRKADELYAGASISSRSSSVEEFYDFYSAPTITQGGSNGLSVNATGSGTSASTVTSPAANRPGILSLSTGTTATGRTTLYNASGMNMLVIGGGYFTTGIDVRHPTLYAAGEDYFTVFGLMSSTGKDQTNGIYVLYDAGGTTTGSAASANYQFVTANAGTRLFTTTSVPVTSGTASDFQRLRIEVTPAGDTARLYIGGTLAATHTGASLPAGANLSLTASITKYGVGTTARTMQIDWIDWRYLFTTPR